MSPRPHESAVAGISLASNNSVTNSSNEPVSIGTTDAVACSNIDSLSINPSNSESTGLTRFSNEACESIMVRGDHFVPSPLLSPPSDLSDLKEYFRRPIIVSTGSLPATRGNILSRNLDLANTVVAFPNGLARLTGVFGVRFTTVYTLVVAATPFHQGLVSMSFGYNVSGDPRVSDPNTCTNMPNVRLDLSATTMAQIKIPFLASFEFFSLIGSGSAGVFSLNALLGVPLPSGTTAPTYKLFLHLEDLELIGAQPYNNTAVTVMSGRVVAAQAAETEEAAFPLSSSVRAASKSVSLLYRAVPLLSSLMPNPSWFLDRTSGALRSFGFSKPTIRDPMAKMLPGLTALEHNVDLASTSPIVGPLSSNVLATDGQLGGTGFDEMSLSYVLSQWSQCTTGTLTTAQTYTTPIVRIPLSPFVMWFRNRIGFASSGNFQPPLSIATVYNSFQPTTLMALASCFRLWKGSFEFRITFAKTKFHAGRLLFTFTPSAVVAIPSSGALNITYPFDATNASPSGCCMTFDLKDSNVVTFTCPYVSSKPFLEFDETFGNFTVCILDPLVGPATVFQSIDYMVEVRASPDFELAVPITNRWPFVASGASVRPQSSRTVAASSGLGEVYSDDIVKYTIGESIASIKQLIQIPKYSNCGGTAAGAVNSACILPWYYTYAIANTVPAFASFPRESFGLPGYFASMYTFANGSTDVHVYTDGGSGTIVDIRNVERAQNYPDTSSTFTNTPFCNNARIFTAKGYALHGRFPAYQSFKRMYSNVLNSIQWAPRFGTAFTSPDTSSSAFGPSSFPVVSVTVPTGSPPSSTVITRCAGDDARLAFYLGPLPFGVLVGAAGPTYDPDSQVGNL